MEAWYRIAKDLSKVAQIWKYIPEEDDIDEYNEQRTFSSKIKEMYQLEYKWSMLKNNPFNGMPQRKTNIENKLEERLNAVAEEVRVVLVDVISEWLDKHALLSPTTWGEKRVEEMQGEATLEGLFSEYDQYAHGGKASKNSGYGETNYDQYFYEIMHGACSSEEKYPFFHKALSDISEDYMEGVKEEARYDLEGFNESHGLEFEDVELAEEWIDDNIEPSASDLMEYYFPEPDLFKGFLKEHVFSDEILSELYANAVFPHWFRYWSSMGIEETRENLEGIYEKLLQAESSDTSNKVASVNLGLNAVHQTGSMIDYVEDHVGESDVSMVLENATEGNFIEKANEELRSIGVHI